jgi:hypothetical protein
MAKGMACLEAPARASAADWGGTEKTPENGVELLAGPNIKFSINFYPEKERPASPTLFY